MTDDDADELQESYDDLESAMDAVLDGDGEPCYACGGEGEYHDCGEDTCCCADPETQDMYDCEECNGTGRL